MFWVFQYWFWSLLERMSTGNIHLTCVSADPHEEVASADNKKRRGRGRASSQVKVDKERLMTSTEAAATNEKLPKGFMYVPKDRLNSTPSNNEWGGPATDRAAHLGVVLVSVLTPYTCAWLLICQRSKYLQVPEASLHCYLVIVCIFTHLLWTSNGLLLYFVRQER